MSNQSASDEGLRFLGDHPFSMLSVVEPEAFDYVEMMEDRRVARRVAADYIDGACTAYVGDRNVITREQ